MPAPLFHITAAQTLTLDTGPFHARLSGLLHGEPRPQCTGVPEWILHEDGVAPGCDCFAFTLSESQWQVMQGQPVLYPLMTASARNRIVGRLLSLIAEARPDWRKNPVPWLLRPLPYHTLVAAFRQRWPDCYLDQSIISRLANHVTVGHAGHTMRLRELLPRRHLWLGHCLRRVICEAGHLLPDADLVSPMQAMTGERFSARHIQRLRVGAGIPSVRELRGQDYGELFADQPLLTLSHATLKAVPNKAAVYELHRAAGAQCYPQGSSSVVYIGASDQIKRRLYHYLGHRAHTRSLQAAIDDGVCLRYACVGAPRQTESMLLESVAGFYGALPALNTIRPKVRLCE